MKATKIKDWMVSIMKIEQNGLYSAVLEENGSQRSMFWGNNYLAFKQAWYLSFVGYSLVGYLH